MKEATLDQATKILSVFKDASADQVQAMLASGGLADLRDADFSRFNRNEHRRVCGLRPLTPQLLEFLGTVDVPAVRKFSVRRSFIVDITAEAPVKISYIGDNFTEWFGDMVEAIVPGETLRYAKLLKPSLDAPILKELGETAEVKLAHIFGLMKLQPNGEDGALLTNGCANVFYARDKNGTLRAVDVGWYGGGWDVGACSVSDPGGWSDGRRVFSRNSSVAVAA